MLRRPAALPALPSQGPTAPIGRRSRVDWQRIRRYWRLSVLYGLAGLLLAGVGAVLGLITFPAGLATLGLAVVLLFLLASHHFKSRDQLVSAALQYAVVAALAVLLSTGVGTTKPKPPPGSKAKQAQAQALDVTTGCPEVARTWSWAKCVWRKAGAEAKRHSPTTTTNPRGKT